MARRDGPAWVHASLVWACSYGWWRTLAMVVEALGPGLFRGPQWLEIGRGVGLREGSGLGQALPPELKGVDRLAEALRSSHWSVLEEAEVSASGSEVELRVLGCSARRALAKWGAEGYECSGFTRAVLEGLAEGLGLRVEVELLEGPRPAGRGEVSCRWRVKVLG